MSLRIAILIMSAFGVISDTILIAFYPQFFKVRYGLDSPEMVGAYVASISVAVMVMLPAWTRLARHLETLRLLFYTQALAGILGLLGIWAPSVQMFWVLSLLMYMTKASYLLLFPYLMRHEHPDNHSLVLGALSVVVHVSAILGASVGGSMLQYLGPKSCILAMAAGDFVQMAICSYLITRCRQAPEQVPTEAGDMAFAPPTAGTLARLLPLCLVMLLFYFSAYLGRPFFTLYWEQATGIHSQLVTGLAFAIPGMMALTALGFKHLRKAPLKYAEHGQLNLMLGAVGLALQACPSLGLIIFGRILYGWSLYQLVVKLDVVMFQLSSPEVYAKDFAVANFFQQLGVLLSSFAAGYLVSLFSVSVTFAIAALGMLLAMVVDQRTFGLDRPNGHYAEAEAGSSG